MTNNLNGKKSYAAVVVAIILTLSVALGGVITGFVLAVRERREVNNETHIAGYLLVDCARELRSTMSALRLCNEVQPADVLCRTGLVHAARAEIALECRSEQWADTLNREAFLNDVASILHARPQKAMELSQTLFELSDAFCKSVEGNTPFDYDGELAERTDHPQIEITDEMIEQAKSFIESALNSTVTRYIGGWDGHMEFNIERGGVSGYAVVCGGKIAEYAFMRDGGDVQTDKEQAKQVALAAAKACGYDSLQVKWSEQTGESVSVVLCKSYDGALACDDIATVVVVGTNAVAWNCGNCAREHMDIPTPKVSETEARRAVTSDENGTLVVHTVDGEERICYEYRFVLEDGVHYVYVCAENGKQIQVK